MKKLLLGALLVVTGAVSFGQVMTEVDTELKTASGTLGIETIGEVVDMVDKTFLVIKPIVSAGPEGTTLLFNHSRIAKGTETGELGGVYEAKVIKGATNEVLTATYKSALSGTGVDENKATVEISSNDEAPKALGTLSYELLTADTETTDVYQGRIVSKFDAREAEGTGSFMDRSVSIDVTVSEIADAEA